MADDKIIIEFDGDIKKLKSSLKASQKEVSRLKKLGGGIGKAISASAGVAAVGVAGLTAGILGAVKAAAGFEAIATQFEVLTGSATKAKDVIKDLQEFSASTPFQFEGIARAGKQLLGFGFSAEDLVPKLKAIGDVASAIGKPIDEIGLIFGQVSAAGKLTGERLLQFQERAIPIGPAIAKTLGVAESAVKDLVSKGKVDFKTFEKAFESLSQVGGFAFQGMIKQSKTFEGVLSTTKDNLTLVAAEIGKELLPAAKNLASAFLGVLKSIRETDNVMTTTVKFWGQIIADSFDQSSEASKKSLGEINAEIKVLDKEVNRLEKSIADSQKSAIGRSFFGNIEQDTKLLGNALADATKLRQDAASKEKELAQRLLEEKTARDAIEKDAAKLLVEEKLKIKLEGMSEEEIALQEAETERRDRERESVTLHEEEIAKIKKTQLDTSAKIKRKIGLEDLKAQVKENNLRKKEEVRFGKSTAQLNSLLRSKELDAAQMGLDALITLGRTGNSKLIIIAKAAGIAKSIIATATGVARATALAPVIGPPAAAALAGTIAAAGAVNVALIAGVKFADGGMFTGGLAGVDSIPAVLQQGEVVAPKRNFEEVIGSVRAKREADKQIEGGGPGTATEMIIGFKDDAFEIIEQKILERRAEGVGLV